MSEGGATIVVGEDGRDEGDVRAAAATARGFAAALLARDAEGAATYLALDNCILTPDGTEVVGRSAVWEVLAQISHGDPSRALSGRGPLVDRDRQPVG